MNSQIRTYLFTVSAILLLGGAVLYLTQWIVAPYLFAVGAAGITVCYLTESAETFASLQCLIRTSDDCRICFYV